MERSEAARQSKVRAGKMMADAIDRIRPWVPKEEYQDLLAILMGRWRAVEKNTAYEEIVSAGDELYLHLNISSQVVGIPPDVLADTIRAMSYWFDALDCAEAIYVAKRILKLPFKEFESD